MVLIERIVNLNNKSRKGQYIYIKEDGYKPRYYKLMGSANERENIRRHYKNKYVKNKRKKTAFSNVREIAKISKIMKKGKTKHKIFNIQNAGTKRLKEAKRELIEPLLTDKKHIDHALKHENQKKFAIRYNFQIEVLNMNGDKIIEIGVYNKTIDQVKKDIRDAGLVNGAYTDKGSRYNLIKALKQKGYEIYKDEGSGEIMQTNVLIGMRKGGR